VQIETNISQKDFEAYQHYVVAALSSGTAPGKQKFSYLNFCFLVIYAAYFVFLLEFYGGEHQSFDWVTGGTAAFPFLVLIIYFLVVSARQMRSYMPLENGVVLGSHIYEVGESGIGEQAKSYSSFTEWGAVKSLAVNQDHIYLFLDTMVAHIIPKRSFADQTEENEFVSFANRKIEGHHA
jgi:hypothetical protein